MFQLHALLWLKWTVFRNAMLSRPAAINRMASAFGSLAELALATLVAAGLGIFSYAATAESDPAEQSGTSSVMFGMLSFIYLMWATVPLN